MLPLDVLLPAAAAVFAGYVVFGISGFGAAPIVVPVLAHFLPLPFVLALAGLFDLSSAVLIGARTHRHAARGEVLRLVPTMLLGLVLGVTLLVNLPRDAALFALGVFVCAYAAWSLAQRAPRGPVPALWAAPAGLAGGVLGALFGVGGPPYVMYLKGRVPEKSALRASIALMATLSVGMRVGAFALAGLYADATLWLTALVLAPVAWAGVALGGRLHQRLSSAAVGQIVSIVLLVTGASLIARAL
ncbi:MAG TPA: sulfite exporter TauE/SafE family protein [Pelomicrobium sp.]|nr:sulfite exporter TauE/SafE family protein [Pelomicrobium sp.]